jgi:hypothetical protein
LNNGSDYADCVTPNSGLFQKACEIAEELNLFIIGEERELYYIPKHGRPKYHIDFERAKEVLQEHGYNLEVIIRSETDFLNQ